MKRYKRKITDTSYSRELTREERILYKKAIKQIEETNRRLEQLERGIDLNKGRYNPKTKRFERAGNIVVLENGKKRTVKTTKYDMRYKTGTWATKKLLNRIGDMYSKKSNKIIMSKKLSPAELRNVIKATRQFLNSKTSTREGIKTVEENTKQTIRNIITDEENIEKFSDQDVETLYSFWNDKDWQDVTRYIDPSDLYVLLVSTESEDDFIKQVIYYAEDPSPFKDLDMQDKLRRIYKKFR